MRNKHHVSSPVKHWWFVPVEERGARGPVMSSLVRPLVVIPRRRIVVISPTVMVLILVCEDTVKTIHTSLFHVYVSCSYHTINSEVVRAEVSKEVPWKFSELKG
jgi:hypothetical protein